MPSLSPFSRLSGGAPAGTPAIVAQPALPHSPDHDRFTLLRLFHSATVSQGPSIVTDNRPQVFA